jgi:hypothetical protein
MTAEACFSLLVHPPLHDAVREGVPRPSCLHLLGEVVQLAVQLPTCLPSWAGCRGWQHVAGHWQHARVAGPQPPASHALVGILALDSVCIVTVPRAQWRRAPDAYGSVFGAATALDNSGLRATTAAPSSAANATVLPAAPS